MDRGDDGATWLGMARLDGPRPGDAAWGLPVGHGVISGASALFGGCATAAALVAAADVAPQPLLWASAHFGALARVGSDVELTVRTISSGRTMSHLEVGGSVEGRESFGVRVAAGQRPDHHAEGTWVTAPTVPGPEASAPFDHPVHEGTWAARFDWRLAGAADPGRPGGPWASWWVRPKAGQPAPSAVVAAAVLTDYVTYGVGRALGRPMGGLSVDNVLRLHRVEAAADHEWLLLEIRPVGIAGGFGQGEARLFAGGELVAVGSQTMVMNGWDWRLPSESTEN